MLFCQLPSITGVIEVLQTVLYIEIMNCVL